MNRAQAVKIRSGKGASNAAQYMLHVKKEKALYGRAIVKRKLKPAPKFSADDLNGTFKGVKNK